MKKLREFFFNLSAIPPVGAIIAFFMAEEALASGHVNQLRRSLP
jgi:hypothetical protein